MDSRPHIKYWASFAGMTKGKKKVGGKGNERIRGRNNSATGFFEACQWHALWRLRAIRKKHGEVFALPKLIDNEANSPTIPSQSVGSSCARQVAESKGISFRFLKNYCFTKGLLNRVGRSYRFDGRFMADSEEHWLPLRSAMKKLKLPKTSFYRIIMEKKWPTLRLGNKLFVDTRKLNRLEI